MRLIPRVSALLLLLGGDAAAQAVSGVVTERTTGRTLENVIVLLLDEDGLQAGHSLTNERGEYRLSARSDGAFRLRTLRVGFIPVTSDMVRLEAGRPLVHDIALASVPVRLDTIAVTDRSVCRRLEDGAGQVATIWLQVRTALLATKLGLEGGGLNAAVLSYRRSLDPRQSTVFSAAGEMIAGRTRHIYASETPARLSRYGYVTADRSGTTFHAPDLDVLLSSEFVRDHCFRPGGVDTATGIATLLFEPTRSRERTPEIHGSIRVDRTSSALRELEFSYTNVGPLIEQSGAGGKLSFVELGNGAWAISDWSIRMPIVERQLRGQNFVGGENVVVELRETGGRLVAAWRGSDSLWLAEPLAVRGVVLDSASGKPVAGAMLELRGHGVVAVSDSLGQFVLDPVVPGPHTIEVRTPQLLSADRLVELPVTAIDPLSTFAVRLPPGATTHLSGIRGVVLTDSSRAPIVAAEVSLPLLRRSTFTDGRGQFELHDIPAGSHQVVIRRLGHGFVDTTLVFEPGRFSFRRVYLSPVQMLGTVEVTADRTIASFEEHRRTGMGRFFTRADLEKVETWQMRSLLSQVSGTRIVSGAGSRAWVMTPRGERSLNNITIPPPEDARMGAKPGCYAQVYVDGILVSPPGLFDINSVQIDQIEAMEFYAGPATTPLRYARHDATCGVLVIWLRRG